MAINVQNSKWLLLAFVSLAAVSGCACQAIPLPGENQCPTDARRLYCSCGEEAVRRCPCGPDSEFYGLKPTCWREWPEGWHCNGCEGMPYVDRALCGAPVAEAAINETAAEIGPTIEAPTIEKKVEVTNPFRSKADDAELPLPPKARETAPTPPAPAKPEPVQLVPAQPTPTAPPALEKTPTETPPQEIAPPETAPDTTKLETEESAVKTTGAVFTKPQIPAFEPLTATAVPAQASPPSKATAADAPAKSPAATPQLNPPLNAPAKNVAPLTPPVEKIAAKPATKKVESAIPAPAERHTEDPALSNRVEQHLNNNLRL